MNPERDYFRVLDIVRENYLVNGHAGVLAARPDFRKLLDHEQITVASEAALARPGIATHRVDRQSTPVLDDQEEWAHVDHRLDHTRRMQGNRPRRALRPGGGAEPRQADLPGLPGSH